ncbi:MAG: HEAT repeat domain-containing protein [Bryobacteraceae bacterium]
MSAALRGDEETAISHLIEKLNSLLEGEEAAAALVACGQRAVGPLRRFLMEGRPSGVYHPRRWAVNALAGLEAKDVLLEYLRNDRPIPDAVARMGEEAVKNAAAAALKQWPSDEVFEVLIGVLRRRALPGAVQTLGELGRTEAAPYIIAALEDDVCRAAAEEALRKMGNAAVPDLALAALNPRPDREQESPSSLLRRSSAAQLLAEIGVSQEMWTRLKPLAGETAPAILIAAARMALRAGDQTVLLAVTERLIAALGDADWYFRDGIGDVLVEIQETARPVVEQEIAMRIELPLEKRIGDPVLRTLLRVKRRLQART